jgi:hypothetical protein
MGLLFFFYTYGVAIFTYGVANLYKGYLWGYYFLINFLDFFNLYLWGCYFIQGILMGLVFFN